VRLSATVRIADDTGVDSPISKDRGVRLDLSATAAAGIFGDRRDYLDSRAGPKLREKLFGHGRSRYNQSGCCRGSRSAVSRMALRVIRNRVIDAHKEWVMRSYVLTFAFVNFRSWVDLPVISTIGTPAERITAVVWTGWTLPLFATEVFLQWKRTGRRRVR
jgi:hypothetical protein